MLKQALGNAIRTYYLKKMIGTGSGRFETDYTCPLKTIKSAHFPNKIVVKTCQRAPVRYIVSKNVEQKPLKSQFNNLNESGQITGI